MSYSPCGVQGPMDVPHPVLHLSPAPAGPTPPPPTRETSTRALAFLTTCAFISIRSTNVGIQIQIRRAAQQCAARTEPAKSPRQGTWGAVRLRFTGTPRAAGRADQGGRGPRNRPGGTSRPGPRALRLVGRGVRGCQRPLGAGGEPGLALGPGTWAGRVPSLRPSWAPGHIQHGFRSPLSLHPPPTQAGEVASSPGRFPSRQQRGGTPHSLSA